MLIYIDNPTYLRVYRANDGPIGPKRILVGRILKANYQFVGYKKAELASAEEEIDVQRVIQVCKDAHQTKLRSEATFRKSPVASPILHGFDGRCRKAPDFRGRAAVEQSAPKGRSRRAGPASQSLASSIVDIRHGAAAVNGNARRPSCCALPAPIRAKPRWEGWRTRVRLYGARLFAAHS